MPERLSAAAPAKVNLVLEVLGPRPDGYHEIDSVMQTLELADRVTIEPGEPGVTVSGPFAGGTPCDETNLAWRAATKLAARLGESTRRLHIALDKQIPAAGGLGGGASDAATTLRLLKRWWPRADEELLTEVANAVGSDEAFFLAGGTARATGRGESVAPLPPLGRHGVVVFVPPMTTEGKTARMFAAIDRFPFDDGHRARAFAGRRPGPLGTGELFNAFERVAFEEFPGLAALRDDLQARIGDSVVLAGAGPALFWIGPESDASRVALATVDADCTVLQTATAGSLWKQ